MNMYKQLSASAKDLWRNETYMSIIFDSLCEMFEYKGIENTDIDKTRLEEYLHSYGLAGITEYNNTLIEVKAFPLNEHNIHGRSDAYNLYFGNGELYKSEAVKDVDCAILFNTSDRMPNLELTRFADMLSEVDLSQVFNIQRSRLAPVVETCTDSQRVQVENILTAISKGNWKVISKGALAELNNLNSGLNVVNFNPPECIQYIQYLSEYHNELTRRIYTLYGMSIQGTGKHAQTNETENHGRDSVSWLLPQNMKKSRNAGLQSWEKTKNIICEYGEIHKREFKKYMQEGENNVNANKTKED